MQTWLTFHPLWLEGCSCCGIHSLSISTIDTFFFFFMTLHNLSYQRTYLGSLADSFATQTEFLFSFSLSKPAISGKPFSVLYSELSMLSCATPLHEITSLSPFSVFQIRFASVTFFFSSLFCPFVLFGVLANQKVSTKKFLKDGLGGGAFYKFDLYAWIHTPTHSYANTC